MGGLLSYSLTASVIILALFPVLHRIISRSMSFRFNRIALLSGLALSLALPCFYKFAAISFPMDFSVFNGAETLNVDRTLAETPTVIENQTVGSPVSFPWPAVAVVVYLSGIIFLLIREIISFLRLCRIIVRCEKKKTDGLIICRITDNTVSPFSWGNYIFLNDSEFVKPGVVYLHEKAHTDKKHWMDLLFADLYCILLWYNPFAWMMRQLMKLNHEFEADNAVIRSGIDTYDYQRLLVFKALGNRSITSVNSFAAGKRSLRKRVLIMNKKPSSKKPLLIAVCAIPALALAWAGMAMPVSSGFLSKISDYSFNRESLSLKKLPDSASQGLAAANEGPATEPDTIAVIPSPIQDQTALAEIIKLSLKTVQPDKETKVNIEIVVAEDGTVKNVITESADGADIAAAIQRELNGIRFEQMTDNGRPIEVHFNVPVQIRKQK